MSKETQPIPTVSPINSSILTIMFVVFLTLKLTGNIDWSWWWVTSPLWLPLVILIGFAAIAVTVGIILITLNKGNK